MYISKNDILRFINANRICSMKQLYDYGLFSYRTPLQITKDLLIELINTDKFVNGSISPYGTFSLTTKGRRYLDTLESAESLDHSNNVSDGVRNQPQSQENLSDKKWYQWISLIMAAVSTIFSGISLLITFLK